MVAVASTAGLRRGSGEAKMIFDTIGGGCNGGDGGGQHRCWC